MGAFGSRQIQGGYRRGHRECAARVRGAAARRQLRQAASETGARPWCAVNSGSATANPHRAAMAHNVIKARPFDYPDSGRLDPASTALLVIDMQIDFLSPGGYLAKKGYDLSPLRAILPAVNRVIDAARAAGCLIVFTRQGHRADMADMAGFDRRSSKRALPKTAGVLLRGSPGFEIVPEIKVRAGDVIVDK